MSINMNDYTDLVQNKLFWATSIINLDIVMRENRYSIETLPIESSINFPNISKAVDEVMGDDYINIIKETSLLSLILQFVTARNPKGSRREILSVTRDVVLDTMKEHVTEKYDIINDSFNIDENKVHEDYTTSAVIELMYKRILAKLEITKENEFCPKLKQCISIYILHIMVQLISYIDSTIFENTVELLRNIK